jgi:hypothetical protein
MIEMYCHVIDGFKFNIEPCVVLTSTNKCNTFVFYDDKTNKFYNFKGKNNNEKE